jgi:hypothetical protein
MPASFKRRFKSFGPVAGFDGDGRAEILVTSSWGLGMAGNTLQSKFMAHNGTHLGDWILEPKDRAVAVGNLAGSAGKRQVLMQKGI